MADRAKKLTELPVTNTAAGDTLLVVVTDPSTNAVTKAITATNLLANSANVVAHRVKTTTAPASASSNGVAGEVRFDSSYVYVCTANNTWKRATISTW